MGRLGSRFAVSRGLPRHSVSRLLHFSLLHRRFGAGLDGVLFSLPR